MHIWSVIYRNLSNNFSFEWDFPIADSLNERNVLQLAWKRFLQESIFNKVAQSFRKNDRTLGISSFLWRFLKTDMASFAKKANEGRWWLELVRVVKQAYGKIHNSKYLWS